MHKRKTFRRALLHEHIEERIASIICVIILVSIIAALIILVANVSTHKMAYKDCTRWQKYSTEYAQFRASDSMKEVCNKIGISLHVGSDETVTTYEDEDEEKHKQIGVASWYDYEISGQEWSKHHDTCASRDWPRYSMLKVTRTDTGASVTCYVNDYIEHPDRAIDLSSHAFAQLAPLQRGLIDVEITLDNTQLSTVQKLTDNIK